MVSDWLVPRVGMRHHPHFKCVQLSTCTDLGSNTVLWLKNAFIVTDQRDNLEVISKRSFTEQESRLFIRECTQPVQGCARSTACLRWAGSKFSGCGTVFDTWIYGSLVCPICCSDSVHQSIQSVKHGVNGPITSLEASFSWFVINVGFIRPILCTKLGKESR